MSSSDDSSDSSSEDDQQMKDLLSCCVEVKKNATPDNSKRKKENDHTNPVDTKDSRVSANILDSILSNMLDFDESVEEVKEKKPAKKQSTGGIKLFANSNVLNLNLDQSSNDGKQPERVTVEEVEIKVNAIESLAQEIEKINAQTSARTKNRKSKKAPYVIEVKEIDATEHIKLLENKKQKKIHKKDLKEASFQPKPTIFDTKNPFISKTDKLGGDYIQDRILPHRSRHWEPKQTIFPIYKFPRKLPQKVDSKQIIIKPPVIRKAPPRNISKSTVPKLPPIVTPVRKVVIPTEPTKKVKKIPKNLLL